MRLLIKLADVSDNSFESLNKTKSVVEALLNLGLEEELSRTSEKSIRAGKGKSRGRKYKKKKGLLIVVADKQKLSKAVSNIPGVDIVDVKSLNVELLAPGGNPGRLTLWTNDAIALMEKENLFN